MFWTPVSGSLVTQSVAVRYGAASKPGVEIGTGRSFRPPSGFLQVVALDDDLLARRRPLTAHRRDRMRDRRRSRPAPISSTGLPMPTA